MVLFIVTVEELEEDMDYIEEGSLLVCFILNTKTCELIWEWVSDCCLTPYEQFFSCFMTRTSTLLKITLKDA